MPIPDFWRVKIIFSVLNTNLEDNAIHLVEFKNMHCGEESIILFTY